MADLNNAIDGNFGGETDLDNPATNSAGNAEDDVGHGRCWIDTDGPDDVAGNADDNTFMVYIGQAGAGGGGWVDPAVFSSSQGQNLIFHSSFLATDGDGNEAASVAPIGWSEVLTPTHGYIGPSGGPIDVTEGAGYVYQSISNAGNEGISQSLASVRASGVYRASVRAKAAVGDVCRLQVAGGTGTVTADTTTTGSYETLSVTATATAVPGALVVSLLSNGTSDTCNWSNPTLVEVTNQPQISTTVFSSIVDPGFIACTASYAGPCGNVVSVDVTPPGPGYIAVIHGSVPILNDDGRCEMRLWDGVTELANKAFKVDNGTDLWKTMEIDHITPTPLTPGTTVKYQLDVLENNTNCNVNSSIGATVVEAKIQVLLVPTGF